VRLNSREIQEAAARFKLSLPCSKADVLDAYHRIMNDLNTQAKTDPAVFQNIDELRRQAGADRALLLQVCQNPPPAPAPAQQPPAAASPRSTRAPRSCGNQAWKYQPPPRRKGLIRLLLDCGRILGNVSRLAFRHVVAPGSKALGGWSIHHWRTVGIALLIAAPLGASAYFLGLTRSASEPAAEAIPAPPAEHTATTAPSRDSLLSVRSYPWSVCSIDGERLGNVPSAQAFRLSPGPHVVRLESAGRHPLEIPLELSPGCNAILRVNLYTGEAQLERKMR